MQHSALEISNGAKKGNEIQEDGQLNAQLFSYFCVALSQHSAVFHLENAKKKMTMKMTLLRYHPYVMTMINILTR